MVDGCFYYLVLRLCLHPEKYFFSSKKFSSVDIFLLFQFWAKQMAWTYKRKSAFVCTKCTSSNYITLWISAPWGSQQDVAAHYHHAWCCVVRLCCVGALSPCAMFRSVVCMGLQSLCAMLRCVVHCTHTHWHIYLYIFTKHIYKQNKEILSIKKIDK